VSPGGSEVVADDGADHPPSPIDSLLHAPALYRDLAQVVRAPWFRHELGFWWLGPVAAGRLRTAAGIRVAAIDDGSAGSSRFVPQTLPDVTRTAATPKRAARLDPARPCVTSADRRRRSRMRRSRSRKRSLASRGFECLPLRSFVCRTGRSWFHQVEASSPTLGATTAVIPGGVHDLDPLVVPELGVEVNLRPARGRDRGLRLDCSIRHAASVSRRHGPATIRRSAERQEETNMLRVGRTLGSQAGEGRNSTRPPLRTD
jgi:hypothetical protein